MAAQSSIEWTDSSWSPIRARNIKTSKIGWHCEHVTTGCEFCYAEGINKRLGTGLPFKPGHLANGDVEIFVNETMLLAPLQWKKPRKIFVCSMTDMFARFVPDEMIDKMFAVMALCPQHTFQVLTKRADRMREYLTKPHYPGKFVTISDAGVRTDTPSARIRVHSAMCDILPVAPARALNAAAAWQNKNAPDGDGFIRNWPLPNVWLGVSAERQQEADERIPLLLQTPAAVRFVSAEPLLGPIDLTDALRDGHPTQEQVDGPRGMHYLRHGASRLDWVIVGGESGPYARPFNISWARSIASQCREAGTSCFIKQLGTNPFYRADDVNCTSQDTGRDVWLIPKDRKGGDWNEWPQDLRIREMPFSV